MADDDSTLLFGRHARVTIDTLLLDGFDVRFKAEKTLKPIPNTCQLSIFNLNGDHRRQLEQLRPKEKRALKGIGCKIEAGYQDNLSQLWLGDLRTINSIEDGPNWVTNLESGDAEKAYQNARINVSYGPQTPIDTALRAMVRALGVGEGNLSKVVSQLKINGMGTIFPHGTVLSGAVKSELTDFCKSADLEWSIQDGAIQFVNRGKALSQKAIKLNSDTGMIGSPTVDNDGVLTVKMQIIPDVRPGTLIVMDALDVKGNYRIEKATWSGDTAAGDWNITAQCKRY